MSNLQKLWLSFGIKIKKTPTSQLGVLLLKAFMMEFQIS